MGYDGSGNFTRSHDWTEDRDNAIAIRADRMDEEFDNFATGMNAVMLRSGVAAMTGDLNMGIRRILALNSGSAAVPAIKFNTDPTSGLYMPASGQVGISAGGALRLNVLASGAAITGALTVSSDITTSGALSVATNGLISGTLGVTGNTTIGGTLVSALMRVQDSTYEFGISTNPYIVFDTGNDFLQYHRVNNAFNFVIGGSIGTVINSAGITTGALALTTPLPIASGGSGAANASGARTNLGLVIGTDVQAQNANLAQLAGLSLAADKLPYANGTGTLTLTDFTTFGRTMAGLANAAAGRTALGVVIGTDVQAQNANLAAFAGLSLIADRLPYANGSGTLLLTTFTTFGRTLAALADASAGRTALGVVIGTDVAAIASPTFTGVPAAPTAAYAANTTQLATTAFVDRLRDVPVAGSFGERGAVSVISAGQTLNTGSAAGTIFNIYNDSGGSLTITQGGGLTLRLSGTATTGNRTIAQRAMATVWAKSTTEYIMFGAGVS